MQNCKWNLQDVSVRSSDPATGLRPRDQETSTQRLRHLHIQCNKETTSVSTNWRIKKRCNIHVMDYNSTIKQYNPITCKSVYQTDDHCAKWMNQTPADQTWVQHRIWKSWSRRIKSRELVLRGQAEHERAVAGMGKFAGDRQVRLR